MKIKRFFKHTNAQGKGPKRKVHARHTNTQEPKAGG